MGRYRLQTDIAIIGGGIAGLWALNQLRSRGYSAILFEHKALGSSQTMASQGMIHGGVKFALGGLWSGGSQAIAAMPAVWRACLEGSGPVDLQACKILSDELFLWSCSTPGSRLTTLLASKLLRTRVAPVATQDYPAALRDRAFTGQVYRLSDLVLDVPSLVDTLAGHQPEAIFRIDWQLSSLRREASEAVLDLPGCTVCAQRLLLTAGAGNEALIAALGSSAPAMQRRPLQQVLVKHRYRESFYGHCIGSTPSPRLTVSSHLTSSGEPLWYLGGELATAGADAEPAALIEKARQELATLFPWLDFRDAEWRTLKLDRAEPGRAEPGRAEPGRAGPGRTWPGQIEPVRPDRAFVGRVQGIDNALVAWPTKLSLTPDLADEVERQLAADGIVPHHRTDLAALKALERPGIATPCWDTLFA